MFEVEKEGGLVEGLPDCCYLGSEGCEELTGIRFLLNWISAYECGQNIFFSAVQKVKVGNLLQLV